MQRNLFFQNYDCKKIIKHHDAFYRGNVNKFTQNSFIKQILMACFPMDMKDTFHISCNRIIKSYLKEKCNVDSNYYSIRYGYRSVYCV